MSEKQPWVQWAEFFAKKTGKCPGCIPSFGLPTDLISSEDFLSAVQGLPLHAVESCSCWTKKDTINIKEVLENIKKLQGKRITSSSDSRETSLAITEKSVRDRVAMLKQKLAVLVNRISVDDFRHEGNSVKWDLKVPQSLFSIFEALKGIQPVSDTEEPVMDLKSLDVKPYSPFDPSE